MRIIVKDWGKPEYLDGAQMRYRVVAVGKRLEETTLAYFSEENDARLFAACRGAKEGVLMRK